MSQYPNSTFAQWVNQFRVTGFPNGMEIQGVCRFSETFQLTSAQLLALQTTAVLLVAAPTTASGIPTPPGGYAFLPKALEVEYVYNSTAYTIANADNAFQIEYVGKTTALLSMTVTGLVDQTASTLAIGATTTATGKIAVSNVANLGLEVKLVGTTPALTLGNGTVNLYLDYEAICLF